MHCAQRDGRSWLLLAAALLITGCVTLESPPAQGRLLRYTPGASLETTAASTKEKGQPVRKAAVSGAAAEHERWEQLLTNAGWDEREARPLPGGGLTPAQAERLLKVLLNKPVTLGTFPARMAVGHLLRRALEHGELSPGELQRWVERFSRIAVLRPDGYLAWVRDGRTQQKVAPVEWRDGAFRARRFELGRFYVSNGFVFRLANEHLEPLERPVLVEVYDDADYLSRSLDGAEAAFVKLAFALGQLLTRPVDSLVALKDLPAGVAALIASSPEYLERFRHMTRGEQIQVAAELATTLLVTKGTASGATRTVTGATAAIETTVPVLALSAEGRLVLERVALPTAQAARALSGGPGAAVLLHRANTSGAAAPSSGRGPGQWAPAEEGGMSQRSRAYQEQISGHSADDAYWVGGVGKKSGGTKFDGFKDGVLLEAKGPGYAEFFEGLDPKHWFEHSGAKGLVDQAERQIAAANGLPIRWHVAEKKAADAIRKLFRDAEVEGVEVVHTPAL